MESYSSGPLSDLHKIGEGWVGRSKTYTEELTRSEKKLVDKMKGISTAWGYFAGGKGEHIGFEERVYNEGGRIYYYITPYTDVLMRYLAQYFKHTKGSSALELLDIISRQQRLTHLFTLSRAPDIGEKARHDEAMDSERARIILNDFLTPQVRSTLGNFLRLGKESLTGDSSVPFVLMLVSVQQILYLSDRKYEEAHELGMATHNYFTSLKTVPIRFEFLGTTEHTVSW